MKFQLHNVQYKSQCFTKIPGGGWWDGGDGEGGPFSLSLVLLSVRCSPKGDSFAPLDPVHHCGCITAALFIQTAHSHPLSDYSL